MFQPARAVNKLVDIKQILFRGIATTNRKQKRETGVAYAEASSADERYVQVDKDTNITLIGIDRFHQRNAINTKAAAQLCAAFEQFDADDESPIAVLYGLGGNLSAGQDIFDLQEQTEKGNLGFLFSSEGSLGPTRRHTRKPVVCGINGYCVAGGLELALMCDLRVMEDTAVLGFFNRHFGVPLTNGGSVRLAAAVGYSRALDIICTGRRVLADEALRIGLINRLVATGTALGQAVHLAFSFAKYSQASLLHDRRAILENTYRRQSFYTALQYETASISNKVLQGIGDGVKLFKNSKTKGGRSGDWIVKDKHIPDWEQQEIDYEHAYARSKTR